MVLSDITTVLLFQYLALLVGCIILPLHIISSRNKVVERKGDMPGDPERMVHKDLPTLLLVSTSLAMGSFVPWWVGVLISL